MTNKVDPYAQQRDHWRNIKRDRPEQLVQPGPGQESVWDYPRPPAVEPVRKRIQVEFNGVVLADSKRALRVIETSSPPVYYVPPQDVKTQYLNPSSHTSFCEWKGEAHYWTIRLNGKVAANAAWSYPDPDPGYRAIKDYLAFYPSRVDACYVGDEQATAQPGSYYGGWVTSNIVGPFKGEPGTESW